MTPEGRDAPPGPHAGSGGEELAVIGAGAAFDGRLVFRGSARVDGRLRGEVAAQGCLVIGERARVDARIEVDELVVAGELEGEVHARQRVRLLASARVTASLRTPRLALAEGCRFEGRCETLPAPSAAPRAG